MSNYPAQKLEFIEITPHECKPITYESRLMLAETIREAIHHINSKAFLRGYDDTSEHSSIVSQMEAYRRQVLFHVPQWWLDQKYEQEKLEYEENELI